MISTHIKSSHPKVQEPASLLLSYTSFNCICMQRLQFWTTTDHYISTSQQIWSERDNSRSIDGGVAGYLLVLAVFLLLLALVCMTKKYERAVNLLHCWKHPAEWKEQREIVHQQQLQHQDEEAMEVKNNNPCISTTQQIPTEDNVAYNQIDKDDRVTTTVISVNMITFSFYHDYEYFFMHDIMLTVHSVVIQG